MTSPTPSKVPEQTPQSTMKAGTPGTCKSGCCGSSCTTCPFARMGPIKFFGLLIAFALLFVGGMLFKGKKIDFKVLIVMVSTAIGLFVYAFAPKKKSKSE